VPARPPLLQLRGGGVVPAADEQRGRRAERHREERRDDRERGQGRAGDDHQNAPGQQPGAGEIGRGQRTVLPLVAEHDGDHAVVLGSFGTASRGRVVARDETAAGVVEQDVQHPTILNTSFAVRHRLLSCR
jgi:hypothetical protein